MEEIYSKQMANLDDLKGFLVYIPCHTDFEMAKMQAVNLRNQFQLLDDQQQKYIEKLFIIISVNGVKLSKFQIESLKTVCDELIYTPIAIGADLNIAQGFFKAIQVLSEFFWILSTNDRIGASAVNEIVNIFLANPDCDLIGADENNVSRKIEVDNVIFKPIDGIHFGLISAVIYRSKNVINNFPAALRLNWTGWGQLGVIQASCFSNKKLLVVTIPKDVIFREMAADRSHKGDELELNSAYYSHSFFGMPLLIASLFANDKRLKRRFLNSWLFSNWYKVSLFSSLPESEYQLKGISGPYWRQSLAEDLIKVNGVFSRVIYFVGKVIDWESFRNVKFAQSLKKWFKP
jgi:hypothetical protein